VPNRRTGSRDSIPLHRAYLTAGDLGLSFPRQERERIWARLPLDHVLVLLATMLADADTNGQLAGDGRDIDNEWAARIDEPTLRRRVQIGVTLHNVLIAPQLLVLAIREALELCPPGSPLGNYAGTGAIVACILGIGDEEQAGRDGAAEPSRWAGFDPELAADLVANLHFNRTIALHHLMAAAEDTWAKPWPDLIASRDRAAVGHLIDADEQLQAAVIRARQHHTSWTDIASVLGTTRQAAQQRFSRA
jgi:hypothetical protein